MSQFDKNLMLASLLTQQNICLALLALYDSSSSSESDESMTEEPDFDLDDIVFGESQPYQFEPQYSVEEYERIKRARQEAQNTSSCTCSNCDTSTAAGTEKLCCNKLAETKDLLKATEKSCITESEGFQVHVHPSILRTYFYSNRETWKGDQQQHGPGGTLSNRQLRLLAYRHLVNWILGDDISESKKRFTMPACIVAFIRRKYPSSDGQYQSFKWPSAEEL